jgi:hypothetical protein
MKTVQRLSTNGESCIERKAIYIIMCKTTKFSKTDKSNTKICVHINITDEDSI